MQIRRDTGFRLPPRQFVTEGTAAYLTAHACFRCRKSWKVPEDSGKKCPQCGDEILYMGRNFKAPKVSDSEQWKKVELLWNNGFRFLSSRRYPDAEPLPERLKDVPEFLKRNLTHPFRVAQ